MNTFTTGSWASASSSDFVGVQRVPWTPTFTAAPPVTLTLRDVETRLERVTTS